jgi:heme-degrading monooxygenase HmoA
MSRPSGLEKGSEGMTAGRLAATPQAPYYAVIFTSIRTAGDRGYAETSDRMVELASRQPGFLGIESVRDSEGVGITVSYWASTEAIAAWKAQAEHMLAQQRGQREWYQQYEIRVARVERAYARSPQRR